MDKQKKKCFMNIFLISVFLLILLIHLYSINNSIYSTSDTFQYLTSAKSLSQLGYNEIYLSDGPTENLIMPTFPLMLSPFYVFGEGNFYLMRFYVVILSLISSILIYILLRKLSDFNKLECILITAIISLSPMFNIYSRSILTDIPYVLLILPIFLLLLRKGKDTLFDLTFLFFLLLASTLMRASAIVLYPSIILYVLIKKRYRLFLPLALSFILSFLFFFLIKNEYYFGAGVGIVFNHGVSSSMTYTTFFYDKLLLLINNIYDYFFVVLPSNVFPITYLSSSILPVIFISIPIFVVSMYGYVVRLKKIEFLEIFYLIHVVFFLVCFKITGNGRYMLSILPLFIYYFFLGIKKIITRFNLNILSINAKKQFQVILLLFLICTVMFSIGMAYSNNSEEPPLFWEDLEEISYFLEDNISQGDLLYSNTLYGRAIYLISEVKFRELNDSAEKVSDFNLDNLEYSNYQNMYFLLEENDINFTIDYYHTKIYETKNNHYTLFLFNETIINNLNNLEYGEKGE